MSLALFEGDHGRLGYARWAASTMLLVQSGGSGIPTLISAERRTPWACSVHHGC